MARMRWMISMVLAVTMQTAPLLAQSGKSAPPSPKVRNATSTVDTRSMITGTVVDRSGSPLPNQRVRLRNLDTKAAEQLSTTNHEGFFQFPAKPDVPYIVELVDSNEQAVAVSELVAPRVREVASTLITAPARTPALGGIFGETAGAVLAAVAGLGITTAAAADAPPVSPEK